MNHAEYKELITRVLLALFPDAKIYLFGSRARGSHKPSSDIDLALDIGQKLSNFQLAQAKGVVDGLYLPLSVDIVDFQAVPDDMRALILNEGILWT